MAILHLNESSSGATRCSGTNGDLNALLKWALVTNGGWTNPFTATNADIFKPASGNQLLLFVNHDSTVSGDARYALVRGCESATGAGTGTITNPFPTVAQIANASANWGVSSVASTTTRNFDIYVAPSWMFLVIFTTGSTISDIGFFGDMSPSIAADTWCTACSTRNLNTAPSGVLGGQMGTASATTSNLLFFVRSIDGTVNSTHASMNLDNGVTTIGNYTAGATMQNGITALIDRQKVSVTDSGATTTTFAAAKGHFKRAYWPNLWSPLHSGLGAVAARDTFTDTAYNAGATFRVFAGSTGSLIVEESNTWSPPVV